MNTQKVASTIANILDAEIKAPSQLNSSELSGYDLVGFGSGIYFSKHHKTLLELADKLPQTATDQKVFIFSTSGQAGNGEKFHRKLREKLHAKGCIIVGEFNCPGYDTYALTKIVGGLQKGHPNQDDLKQAEAFAESLKQKA
jgi:flavodoxin